MGDPTQAPVSKQEEVHKKQCPHLTRWAAITYDGKLPGRGDYEMRREAMIENKHWLTGSSFLPLFQEAIDGTERTLADRLDRRGEIERPEPVLTTILIEALQTKLDTINANLRDLENSRPNQPVVSRFDFTICDMQDTNRDVLGADLAFIFRSKWEREFLSKRGILLQAKRLRPMSSRTFRRLEHEVRRLYGVSLREWEDLLPPPLRHLPRLRRARFPWPFWPMFFGLPMGQGMELGDFLVEEKQLEELVSNVVSSYYLFYDYPLSHLRLPCVQAHTVRGLTAGSGGPEIARLSVLRQSMSFTDLLVDELVGCRVGEWNESFNQLAVIADQRRVGSIDTTEGSFQVHAYNVRFIVVMDVTFLPVAYGEGEEEITS